MKNPSLVDNFCIWQRVLLFSRSYRGMQRRKAYPTRPVRIIVPFPAGQAIRQRRASRGSIAVGATWAVIRY